MNAEPQAPRTFKNSGWRPSFLRASVAARLLPLVWAKALLPKRSNGRLPRRSDSENLLYTIKAASRRQRHDGRRGAGLTLTREQGIAANEPPWWYDMRASFYVG